MSSISIPCITLGKHRHIAETIAENVSSRLTAHNFSVNAILDEDSFSPANIAVISRALAPRPKVLIIGGGFSDEQAEGAIEAWDEYVKEVGVEGTAVIRVTPGTLQKVGAAGIVDWLVEELKVKFK